MTKPKQAAEFKCPFPGCSTNFKAYRGLTSHLGKHTSNHEYYDTIAHKAGHNRGAHERSNLVDQIKQAFTDSKPTTYNVLLQEFENKYGVPYNPHDYEELRSSVMSELNDIEEDRLTEKVAPGNRGASSVVSDIENLTGSQDLALQDKTLPVSDGAKTLLAWARRIRTGDINVFDLAKDLETAAWALEMLHKEIDSTDLRVLQRKAKWFDDYQGIMKAWSEVTQLFNDRSERGGVK